LRHGAFLAFLRGKLDGLRQFRAARDGSGDVRHILAESEQTLLALQRRTGFDWYWRLYFALT